MRGPSTLGVNYVERAAVEEGDSPVRAAAFAELVATEESYVHNLGVMVRHWMNPLQEVAGQEALPVFGNVQLLESVNSQLLQRLRRPEAKRAVGEQFLQMLPFFKMYKDYCGKQELAAQCLEKLKKKKAVREVLEKQAQVPAVNGLTLESYLIMPMQRICRYPLVLAEIYKNTPDEWPDKAKLKEALEAVSMVGREVNEQKRSAEQQILVLQVQTDLLRDNKEIGESLLSPGRRLIGEKELRKVNVFGEDEEDVLVYAFNDTLLVCKKDKKKLRLLHRVALSAVCTIQDLPYGLEEPVGFAVHCGKPGRVELTFGAEDQATATEWREQLKQSFEDLKALTLRRTQTVAAPPGPKRASSVMTLKARDKPPVDPADLSKSPPATSSSSSSPPFSSSSSSRPSILSRSATGAGVGGWRRGTVSSKPSPDPAPLAETDLLQKLNRLRPNSMIALPSASKSGKEEEEEHDEEEESSSDAAPQGPPRKPLPIPKDDDGEEEEEEEDIVVWGTPRM